MLVDDDGLVLVLTDVDGEADVLELGDAEAEVEVDGAGVVEDCDGVGSVVAVDGQVCERLNHSSFLPPPVVPSTWATAETSFAPGSEAAYAWFSFGGPKTVMTCSPPGSNFTVSFTKETSFGLPGAMKCQPSFVAGMDAQVSPGLPLYWAA